MRYAFSYDTKIGKITIAEEEGKITNFWLPSREPDNLSFKETPLIAKAAEQFKQYLEGKRKEFDLKLNPQGTPFQKRVWKELLKIPYGETRSYKDIAKAAGNEKACRAVGAANNKNPVAVFIPCHRVIGSDGKLTGYAGGLNLKEKLLNFETNGVI